MISRSVSPEDLARHKAEREAADQRYNEALTALDAAIAGIPDLPHAPPAPDEHQITPLNERWEILTAEPSMPPGWRGRLTRFVWRLVEPLFARQQAFNSSLVDHINRNAATAREVPRAIASAIELVRQQAELARLFQLRVLTFAQQITPFVDTKDHEFHRITRRVHEDGLEATARVGHRLSELIHNELPFVHRRVNEAEHVAQGAAGGLNGVSDEMLKRFESATARLQRAEAGLGELQGTVSSVQQLAHLLRREIDRRDTTATTTTGTSKEVPSTVHAVMEGTASPLDEARGALSESRRAAVPGSAQQLLASDPIHSHQYVGFEDLYRGSELDIKGRMADYVELFAGASDVLDIGCGRGELLALFGERGITARGIDLNHEMVARCRAAGLDVVEADALGYLAGLPDESLGGLIATQVVEHLAPDQLLRLLTVAFDKLRPNARLVLETINPASWAAFFDSYIRDLTHMRPVHPDTLKYLVTGSGFADATIVWRSPYPEQSKLQPLGPTLAPASTRDASMKLLTETFDRNVERLNGLLFTHMDYAIVARRA